MLDPMNLLGPLDGFYHELGLSLPLAERVMPEAMPQPYRKLLVHERDMTSTLERFHNAKTYLELIHRKVDVRSISRMVTLTPEGGTPVEFGAIVIYLTQLPDAAREAVLECRIPLGAILKEHRVHFMSCPQAFLRVQPDQFMRDSLRIDAADGLYGRRNNLLLPDHSPLADILEILPPASVDPLKGEITGR